MGRFSADYDRYSEANRQKTGIVYNFHHGHEHLAMPDFFNAMVPHLLCVNLNGMAVDGEKILPLGDGENDLLIEYGGR